MFKYRSKTLFICGLLGTAYLLFIISYFGSAVINSDGAEQIGAGIATVLVIPHMLILGFAVLFNWLGFALKGTGFSLTAAILYCIASLLFIPYLIFVLPMIVLGFIGYSKQKKHNLKLA